MTTPAADPPAPSSTVPRPGVACETTSASTPAAIADHSPQASPHPLLAVCGLQGGAGTSTLANLIATTAAATHASHPVVLCEAPGATGDQAALTGAPSRVSLGELAGAVAAGRPPRGFWGRSGALRVLATPPAPTPAVAAAALADVLRAAQAGHGLTVVDVGTVRDPHARAILRAATHVLWVLGLQPGAVERARATLASGLVPALAARQALAARAARPRERFAGEGAALRRLAAEHTERLVLVPELPLRDGAPDPASGRAQRVTTGLARFLGASWPA